MQLGKVYLVGAGPGDPDLLTIKARDLIAAAGCIVYDHLVNPEILKHAQADAEIIYAGKQAGKCAMKQETINALLVTKVTEHKIVVRLKGGDPFVFGRGGEEAETLVDCGIAFEIVPGISSGVAAAAYAGIPVTQRGLSTSVTFVTGHEDPTKGTSTLNWEHLAKGTDTLVFFMGVGHLTEIAESLIVHGRAENTPLAVIQWGTYEHQVTHLTELANVRELIARKEIKPPAIIVIGEVVRMREKLRWFENATELKGSLEQSSCPSELQKN